MKSKLAALLALSILASPVYSQQLTTQQQEFQKRYDALQNKYNLYHRALEHITEFTMLEQTQQEIADFQKEVQAAAIKAQADAAKPATPAPAAPAKTTDDAAHYLGTGGTKLTPPLVKK